MIGSVRNFIDRVRGNGVHAITTPPMDGVLQPNNLIEEAPLLAAVDGPDNLVQRGEDILFSSGKNLMRLEGEVVSLIEQFPHEISALSVSPKFALAIVLSNGQLLIRGGKQDGLAIDLAGDGRIECVTALCFTNEQTIYLCQGSSSNQLSGWKRDLMERNASGLVWKLELAKNSFSKVADGLAFPYGIISRADGAVVVSESWKSRLISIDASGKVTVVLGDLPGYPARLAPRSDGDGAWLAIFAPRSQLIEFVLRERKFCRKMLQTIEPDLWMAPSLSAPHSFLEPLQGGGLKQLGVMKPWAPTRSFGLVVSLDGNFEPIASWHSRADGTRHGITSVVDRGETVIAASKGGGALIALKHSEGAFA